MTARPIYVLHLQPAVGVDAVRALRSAVKRLLRCVERAIKRLAKDGLCKFARGSYRITAAGKVEAKRVAEQTRKGAF